MRFQILLSILVVSSFNILGQDSKNDDRVKVAETRISLIPPAGFSASKEFSGFQKGDAIINVMDLAGGNYFANTATFTRAAFEDQEITVYDFQETVVNGYPAKFIHVEGNGDTKSYNLVFGDSTFSVMVIAAYPSNDASIGETLKQSILTAQYDKSIVINPLETATFTIDDSANAFKFAQATSNMFIYSLEGKKENMNNGTIILVIPLPAGQSSTPELTCEQMVIGLEAQGFDNLVTSSNSKIVVNGNTAHEILVTGIMNGNTSYILTRVVKKGKRQVVIQGIMTGNIDYIQDIRDLSTTLRFK